MTGARVCAGVGVFALMPGFRSVPAMWAVFHHGAGAVSSANLWERLGNQPLLAMKVVNLQYFYVQTSSWHLSQ